MGHENDWQPTASLATLRLRAALLARVRGFFAQRDFLEVETPILAHAGAADAQLAQFLIEDPIHGQMYLQTSPEYAMKRLLIAGSGSIFQIAKAFRQGEAGSRHNPEFTIIEWYALGYDDKRLREEVCALIAELLPHLKNTPRTLSFSAAFKDTIDVDPLKDRTDKLRKSAYNFVPSAKHLTLDARDDILDLLMSQAVAPRFPDHHLTVVTDYPASQAALARVRADGLADRFEVYCGALELANGFYEAANPRQYAGRFEEEARRRRERDLCPIPTDERLLAALTARPLPDCAGVAVGFDRLVMLAVGAAHINETLAFAIDRA